MTMVTLEQMTGLFQEFELKFDKKLDAKLDAKLAIQTEEIMGVMARAFAEFRAEWKADLKPILATLQTIEENYVTKDDLMTFAEYADARYVLKAA